MDDRLARLHDEGARYLRIGYSDLHGVARGKDLPIAFADQAIHGVGFCEAIMTTDLHHNVVAGFEHGFRDIAAIADLDTVVRVPWDPEVAWCLGDLVRLPHHEPYPVDPRGALRRAIAAIAPFGEPVVAPEHEFYLCERDADAPGGFRQLADSNTPVYTVGTLADPRGVMRDMLDALNEMGFKAIAGNHEYGRNQYEINLLHGPALEATDRAFRYKQTIKEVASHAGLTATFIGKPFSHDEGSGFHLHVSLVDGEGRNLFDDPTGEHGVSPLLPRFVAGVLAHAPALTAILNPTVNAYRRFVIESLAPTHANWGYGNRLCMVRVSDERGRATRIEMRNGDGAANVYLAVAAVLFAGLDGMTRELEPPAPLGANPYDAPEEEWGRQLPGSLGEALDALDADPIIRGGLGDELVDTFLAIKRYELDRWNAYLADVTPWEVEEYFDRL
jgi:glutamine synthetase